MSELSAIQSAIHDADDDANRLTLADWHRDNGRDDEATAIRVFFPAIRDSVMAGMTVEQALSLVARHAVKLGRAAREIEDRDWSDA